MTDIDVEVKISCFLDDDGECKIIYSHNASGRPHVVTHAIGQALLMSLDYLPFQTREMFIKSMFDAQGVEPKKGPILKLATWFRRLRKR